MKDRKTKQRIRCLALATAMIILCLSSVLQVPVLAANDPETTETAKATTMHLEKVLGTVEIEDEEEKTVHVRKGMQLYSGYTLETARSSFAWISLDKTKAVKLDVLSAAQIRQQGKALEIDVTKGGLFFDVSRPLEADESLNIRTSTTIMGIRGTCGWIRVIDEHTVQIALLEGKVDVQSTDPETGEPRTVTVEGGQILTVVYYGDDAGDEEETIEDLIDEDMIQPENVIHEEEGLRVEELDEKKVPFFAGKEVFLSPDLQQRITDDSPLSVKEILKTLLPKKTQDTDHDSDHGDGPSDEPPVSGGKPSGSGTEDTNSGSDNTGSNEPDPTNPTDPSELPPPDDWPTEYGEVIWKKLVEEYGLTDYPTSWPDSPPSWWGAFPWPPKWTNKTETTEGNAETNSTNGAAAAEAAASGSTIVEEIPTVETPADETVVEEAPVAETPVVEAPASEAPVVEAPASEAPVVEAPASEAPVVEAPAVETPVVEAPAVEAPTAETPVAEAPAVEAPAAEAPVVEAPAEEQF